MPLVSTQKLYIPCPPPERNSWAEWAARQKQAGEETAAIEKAKEILSDSAPMISRAQKGSQRTWRLELDMGFKM